MVAIVIVVVVAGYGWPVALSFSDDFFIYYFNVLNVKIEDLM